MSADINLGLFHGRWRVVWRSIRQQRSVLSQLFEAAREANDAIVNLSPPAHEMESDDDVASYIDWVEQYETRLDARDAYASALAIFFDNLLKPLKRDYKKLAGPRAVARTFNGFDLADVFYYAANNVRHYEEWLAPFGQIPQKDRAYENVSAIAKILGREVPKKEHCSLYAVNYAYTLIRHVAKDYALLEKCVRAYLKEMITNSGLAAHPFTQHELEQT